MEQLLRPYRRTGGRRAFSTAKPGSLLKASIPTRTFAYWDEDQTGFLEMNLVAHRGETTDGFYLNTLSTVDIPTGWVECQAVWGKGQDRVGGAVHHVARSLSFPLSGLDSDNGGKFINQHLYAYCQRNEIKFTRSRPHKKNDNAHAEQKNWSVVRRLVGYDRYSSKAAFEKLHRTYSLLDQHTNFFQPVMKLQHKTRHGAKVHKLYDTAKTLYWKLLERQGLTPDQQERLAKSYGHLNPLALLRQIDSSLEKLWALADHDRQHMPSVTVTYDATRGGTYALFVSATKWAAFRVESGYVLSWPIRRWSMIGCMSETRSWISKPSRAGLQSDSDSPHEAQPGCET